MLGTGYPPQMTPYAIGLGVLMFATAFAAAFAVYRHHRVLDAIVLLGAALIVNMSAILTDLFVQLLLFVVAALLLWLRAALVDRQDGWQRRRVNETLEVPDGDHAVGDPRGGDGDRSGLAADDGRGGLAADRGVAQSMDGVWTGVRDQFDGVFGSLTNPQSRISGNSFGSSLHRPGRVGEHRRRGARPRRPDGPLYLRTVTYDVYTGHGWDSSASVRRGRSRRASSCSTGSTSERPIVARRGRDRGDRDRDAADRSAATCSPRDRRCEIYAPAIVSEPLGAAAARATSSTRARSARASATSSSVAISTATEAELGAAGDEYPEEVRDLYLDTSRRDRPAWRGRLARASPTGAENNYERAEALADYLKRDPSFTYSTTAGVPPSDQDFVDFFLFDPELGRSGYCQYYATAMVMMARSVGLPARLAVGFAPGERQDDDTFLVREANAHAWAEIYFPGYGWQIFEATKSINPGFGRASGNPTSPGTVPLTGIDPLLETRSWSTRCAATAATSCSRRRIPSRAPSIRTSPTLAPTGRVLARRPTPCSSRSSCSAACIAAVGPHATTSVADGGCCRPATAPGASSPPRRGGPASARGRRRRSTSTPGWLEDQLPNQASRSRPSPTARSGSPTRAARMTLSGAHKLENALRQLRCR